jgi:hypothetical protein
VTEYAGSNHKYIPTKFSEEANGGDTLVASNTHNLVMRFVNVLHFSAWVLMAADKRFSPNHGNSSDTNGGHRVERLT